MKVQQLAQERCHGRGGPVYMLPEATVSTSCVENLCITYIIDYILVLCTSIQLRL